MSIDTAARDRNVSGASQFPMRSSGPAAPVDPTAYQAKEIAQPSLISRPIESLPSDLPYPSLATKEPEVTKTLSPGSPYGNKSAEQKGGIFNAFRSNTKRDTESHRRSLDPQARAISPASGLDRAQSRMSQDSSHNPSRPAGPRHRAK